jgi:hypothetical protein
MEAKHPFQIRPLWWLGQAAGAVKRTQMDRW